MIIHAISQYIPLADNSIHMVVTSPPYWGLRSYLPAGHPLKPYEIGTEPLHDCLGWATGEQCGACYVCHLRAVFTEVRRVLRPDGTLWLNLGDSYNSKPSWGRGHSGLEGRPQNQVPGNPRRHPAENLKPKDLVGIPWRVALALQSDGWWLRNDIIWHKPNPMPESVTDRCTRDHEYVFLFSKSERYFFDHEAIKEPLASASKARLSQPTISQQAGSERQPGKTNGPMKAVSDGTGKRNKRTVWKVPTANFAGAHFATYPPDLISPPILAGTSQRGVCSVCGAPWEREIEKGFTSHDGDTESLYNRGSSANRLALLRQAARARGEEYVNRTKTIGWNPTCTHDADPVPAIVFDPFAGSGTTGEVCRETGRRFIGIDLNEDYLRKYALPRAEHKQTRASLATLPMFGGEV